MMHFILKIILLSLFCSSISLAAKSQYLQQIPTFWTKLYPNGGNTLYCDSVFKPFDRKVNIEHVFPMGWVVKQLQCKSRKQCRKSSRKFNIIESDMHNLFPAQAQVNKKRGAMAYAEIKGERWIKSDCDFEIDKRRRKVEPRKEIRGDIARAMLYMSDRYQLILYKKQKQLLMRWHFNDPVSAEELRRNHIIRKTQGNANPYISVSSLSFKERAGVR